jgi:hypothetical protein
MEFAMRYMLMFKPDKEPPPGEHACRQHLPEMAALIGDLKKSGVLISTEGLLGSDSGARIKYTGGKMTVTDGPFAEAKELIAGVAIVEVKSRTEAVELAKRFLTIAGGGIGDVLEIAGPAGPDTGTHK